MEPSSVLLPVGEGYVEAEFQAWWNELAAEDRVAFTMTFNGGKKLAAFVYLLDKWMISPTDKHARPDMSMIVTAYALTHACPIDVARGKFREALDHPAVQDILSRLTYRENFSAFMRIQHKGNQLVEKVVDVAMGEANAGITAGKEGNVAVVALGVKAFQGMQNAVTQREAQERAERTRGAMARARAAADEAANAELPPDEEIVIGLRRMREKLGSDRFEQLVAASRVQELGS